MKIINFSELSKSLLNKEVLVYGMIDEICIVSQKATLSDGKKSIELDLSACEFKNYFNNTRVQVIGKVYYRPENEVLFILVQSLQNATNWNKSIFEETVSLDRSYLGENS